MATEFGMQVQSHVADNGLGKFSNLYLMVLYVYMYMCTDMS